MLGLYALLLIINCDLLINNAPTRTRLVNITKKLLDNTTYE